MPILRTADISTATPLLAPGHGPSFSRGAGDGGHGGLEDRRLGLSRAKHHGLPEFTDAWGHKWQAWDVRPSAASLSGTSRAPALANSLQLGWIAFRSDMERRRLAPPIPNWERLSEELLCRLLLEAELVPPRRT